jgi:hypothetical protein
VSELDAQGVREALAAARELAQAKAAGAPQATSRGRLPRSGRAREVIAEQLARIGFDVAAVEEALAADRAENNRRSEELKAVAVEQSAARAAALRALVDRWKTPPIPGGVEIWPPQTSTVYLDSPIEISATDSLGLDLESATIAPYNSSAKARWELVDEGGFGQGVLGTGGEQSIHFSYLWTNPQSDVNASVTINAPLMLNGSCEVHTRGGFLDPDFTASLVLEAELNLIQCWTQPFSNPPPQANQSWAAPELSVTSSGWLHSGDKTEIATETGVYALIYDQELVPPGANLIIDVALSLTANLFNGKIIADFASGDFEVLSPYVQLTISFPGPSDIASAGG